MSSKSQHSLDMSLTFMQKALLWVSSLNISAAIMAIFDFIPRLAPVISIIFVIWVGALTVRERKLNIKRLEREMGDKNEQ